MVECNDGFGESVDGEGGRADGTQRIGVGEHEVGTVGDK